MASQIMACFLGKGCLALMRAQKTVTIVTIPTLLMWLEKASPLILEYQVVVLQAEKGMKRIVWKNQTTEHFQETVTKPEGLNYILHVEE